MRNTLIILLLLVVTNVFGTPPRDSYTTIASGDWSNTLSWDNGVPLNDQTGGNDDLSIEHNITLTGDLDMKSGATLTITAGVTLTVNGNADFNNGSSILVETGGTLIINGNVINSNNSDDVIINGVIVISGNYDGGTGSDLGGTGSMDIDGTVTTDGASTVFGSEEDCTVDCDNSDADPLGDPLPIELVFFSGSETDDGAQLEWLTESEINNDFFQIERSQSLDEWELIGTVKGSGTRSNPKMYSFIDNNPYDGYNYYYLYQVDFDGVRHKERMTYVFRVGNNYGKGMKIWPNPVSQNNEVNIELIGFNGEEVLIVVMDVLGNTFYEKAVLSEIGRTLTVINSSLSRGNYLVVGSTKQELYKKKLIVK